MSHVKVAARTILAIARVTFSEVLRDRVLYGALVVCGAMLILGALVSNMSFVRPERILVDFGLLALAISSGFLGILGGAVVLVREFDRRTAFIALARPISRMEFLVGKFTGLALVLIVNSVLISTGFLLLLHQISGSDGSLLSFTLIQALFLLAIQSLVLAAISLFFSSFSTSSLSLVMTFGIYLVGINSSQIRMIMTKQDPGVFRSFMSGIATIIPNFEHFNLGLKVSYGLTVPAEFVVNAVLYALMWIVLVLIAAGALLERKES